MNTSLSDDLHRWADEEPDARKRNFLRCAARRARVKEEELHALRCTKDERGRVVPLFQTTTKENMPEHFAKSIKMLGPKDGGAA